MNSRTTYTASNARKDFYTLVKNASQGVDTYEIALRGSDDTAVLISKNELEAWQETLDVLSSGEEVNTIIEGKKQKKTVSHDNFLKEIGM